MTVRENAVEVPTTKVRGLLGVLAFRSNETMSTDYLVNALWDDDGRGHEAALKTYMSRLRNALNASGFPANVRSEHNTHRLEISPSIVDYQLFRASFAAGRRDLSRGQYGPAADHFAAAVDLWRGPLIADLRTSWARGQREALTMRDRLPAYSALFDAKLALGEIEFVLDGLAQLLSDHPNNDTLAGQWMRALAEAERSSEIPAYFRDYCERLQSDPGVEPSPELIRIFQETSRGRPPTKRAAPALRIPPPPRETPHFTGRTELLTRLDALLSGPDAAGRVVALDGRPGVGKTALIRYWARSRRHLFPDGMLHINLAGYADEKPMEPGSAMGEFLDELGMRIPNGTDERATLLRHTLSGRRSLVILDNLRNSSHARPLLAATADCPVVLTSRKQLTGSALRDGAVRITVPELHPAEATALLAARIGERAAAEPDAIEELVGLCERVPLALVVVAEHVASRSEAPIRDLVGELRQMRRLLDAGSHGDDDTVTLRSALSWSYRALSAEEGKVLRSIGLLPAARFSSNAVAAVSQLDRTDVDRPLDALVGAHLIEQEGAGRYRAHDISQAYAADCARRDESAESRTQAMLRLLTWYVESARNAQPFLTADPHQVPGLPAPEPVTPTSFATTEEAKRWFDFERAGLVELCRRATDDGFDEAAWRLAACLNVMSGRGDLHELLEVQRLGRFAAARAGRREAEAGCLSAMGVLYAALGDNHRAEQCFEESYQGFLEAGDQHGASVATYNIGCIRLRLGKPVEAIDWHRRALAAFTAAHDEWFVANAHRWLGDDHLKLGEYEEAHRHYLESQKVSRDRGFLMDEGKALIHIAQLHLAKGRPDLAVDAGEAGLDIHDRTGDRASAAEALCTLAMARTGLGEHAEAILHAQEAARAHEEMHNAAGQGRALRLLGDSHAAAGEDEEARSAWSAAADLLESIKDPSAAELRTKAGQPTVPTPRHEPTGKPDERAASR
jgi:DNA-binding SARP family transcriptional activator/tetratricopeptide (TPR) repeat protein